MVPRSNLSAGTAPAKASPYGSFSFAMCQSVREPGSHPDESDGERRSATRSPRIRLTNPSSGQRQPWQRARPSIGPRYRFDANAIAGATVALAVALDERQESNGRSCGTALLTRKHESLDATSLWRNCTELG